MIFVLAPAALAIWTLFALGHSGRSGRAGAREHGAGVSMDSGTDTYGIVLAAFGGGVLGAICQPALAYGMA